jgi:hypothetical protein
MDELRRLCVRMIGDGQLARAAEQSACDAATERLARLRAGLGACRDLAPRTGAGRSGGRGPRSSTADEGSTAQAAAAPADRAGADAPVTGDPVAAAGAEVGRPDESQSRDLRSAVAREVELAVSGIGERGRASLALRDLLGLSHAQVGEVLGLDSVDVAAVLATARVSLRDRLRAAAVPLPQCAERERALRTMALRQDGEEVAAADEDWIIDHLGLCPGCARAHAAMLEAVACYRAWPDPGDELVAARGGETGS